jgi:hypothetical protein
MKIDGRKNSRPPPPIMIGVAVGSVFGDWITLASPVRDYQRRRTTVLCRCVCGKEKEVMSRSLRTGVSASCGCTGNKLAGKKRSTHGHTTHTSHSPEYASWNSMRQRCHNPKAMAYAYYGARGITVCEQWRESFATFLADMGGRPNGHSLERVDNDRGYNPGNCRWATTTDQMRNTRRAVRVTLDGEEMNVTAACAKLGISPQRIYWHTFKHGLPAQEVLDRIVRDNA